MRAILVLAVAFPIACFGWWGGEKEKPKYALCEMDGKRPLAITAKCYMEGPGKSTLCMGAPPCLFVDKNGESKIIEGKMIFIPWKDKK